MSNTSTRYNPKVNKQHIRLLLGALLISAIAIFEEYADPFGLVSTTDKVSATVFSAMISPFYGDQKANGKSGQEEILVVLYDESFLKHKKQSWPLKTRTHRQILERLAAAGADSIYLDVYFNAHSTKRELQIGRLVSDIQGIEEDYGSSIWLAGLKHDPTPQYAGVIHERFALAEMLVEDHEYALTQTVDGKRYPTGAYALYQDWCSKNQCSGDLSSLEDSTMFIQWGYAPSDRLRDYYAAQGVECQSGDSNIVGKIVESLELLVMKAFNGLSGAWKAKCTYNDFISASLIAATPVDQLKEFVDGKTVLVGTQLDLVADIHRSTVHGDLPGVFWHAAALDNLIEYNDKFLRKAPSGNGLSLSLITVLAVTFFYTFLSMLMVRLDDSPGITMNAAARARLNLILGFFVIISMGIIWGGVVSVHRWAPENWLGAILALAIVNSDPFTAIGEFCFRRRPVRGRLGVLIRRRIKPYKYQRRAIWQVYSSVASTLMFMLLSGIAYLLMLTYLLVGLINPNISLTSSILIGATYLTALGVLGNASIQKYKKYQSKK